MLFLSRRDGVRITELADAIKGAATADLEAEEAARRAAYKASTRRARH
jgi:hypothetical protein